MAQDDVRDPDARHEGSTADPTTRPQEPWVLRRGWRLYATLLLMIVVPAMLLVAVIVLPVRSELLAQARTQNRLLSRMLAAAVDEELRGLRDYVASIATRPNLVTAIQAEDRTAAEVHLQALVNRSPRLTRAFFTDERGIERYDYPHDPSVIGKDFSYRDWFVGVSSAQDTYISELYHRSALGQPLVVSVATPVRDAHDDRTIGYLVGQYLVDDLRDRMSQLSPVESVRFAIIDHRGRIVTSTSDPGAVIPDSRLAQRETWDPNRSTTITLTNGEQNLVNATHVPTPGWTAVAYTPRDAAIHPVHSLLRTILVLFLLCITAMSILGVVLVRTMRRYSAALLGADAQLREATQMAEAASHAKSDFLAVMSHELRTPLNGVIGMTELLRDTELDDRQRRFLDACHDSAHSLLGLVNDILDLSKIEAGRLELADDDFALHQCVDDSVALMAHRAHAKGLELSYYVDPKVRRQVRGDDTRLRQIIVNLLSNAIKFTEEGHIVLRAVLDNQDAEHITVRCSVTDSGIGIPADRRDRLFRSFSQLDRSTTRKYGGTGLGLAICRSLAEAMDGEIGVESVEGEGSTFWFRVRLACGDDRSPDLLLAPHDLRSLRVLIVSECETAGNIIAQTFASWDISADVVIPDRRLLDLFDDPSAEPAPFDLVVFDLPVCEGPAADMARDILQLPALQDLRVFVLTPTNGDGACDFAHGRIVERSLRKPPSASELLNALIDCFCTRREHAQPGRADIESPYAAGTNASVRGRILLAEDNRTSRMYVTEVLARAGFVCDVAENGEEAVHAMQRQRYNLVLMDCHMPNVDGFEATATIRRLEAEGAINGPTPVIALTANAIKGDRERCLQAGMNDYISKPAESVQLLRKVEEWLSTDTDPNEKTAGTTDAADGSTRTPVCTPEEPPPLDIEVALERCMGDVKFLLTMLETFERETPRHLEAVESTVRAQDTEAVRLAAHAIKGAAGMITAEELQSLAATIEDSASHPEQIPTDHQVQELRRAFERCVRFIHTYRDLTASPETGEQAETADASARG